MTKLNDNQIRFCEQYVANGYHGTQAYRDAYGLGAKKITDEGKKEARTASTASCTMLRDFRIIEKIKEIEGDYRIIGHKLGIDKKAILGKLRDLLSAKKQVFYDGAQVGVVDDNASVNKAVETILKIMGDFAPEKSEVTIEEGSVDFSKMSEEEKKEYKEKLLRSL